MINQQHPITPPDALRTQWRTEAPIYRDFGVGRENWLMNRAAQWGADQELEACCEWIHDWYGNGSHKVVGNLQAARRPEPPSLKDQALKALERQSVRSIPSLVSNNDCDTIRRALEQLND
jgi:hypothetical protein